MKKLIVILFLIIPALVYSQGSKDALARWTFDEAKPEYKIVGKGMLVDGVMGKAYKFDGFSSYIEDTSYADTKMPGSFSVSAWVALGAYPWNWAPILTTGRYKISGFYFGVDSRGRVGFQVSNGTAVWHTCSSELIKGQDVGMELRKWYHVTCTYSPENGMAVYLNGKKAGTCNNFTSQGKIRYSEQEKGFRIGMNREKLAPTDPVREWATWPSRYSIDGLLDEITLFSKELSAREVAALYDKTEDKAGKPALQVRDWPKAQKSGRFGANYTRLKYYPGWDNLWPAGDQMDVVVQFDELPIKVMFWRGTRYSACWVSENNKWMADQSRETGNNWFLKKGSRDEMPTGCMEHMSDVQCRSSRVAIIENNDARVVVNWRYLQMDVLFRQNDLPDNTGFGEWGNELYYIYPDGVGIRKVLPGRGGWQETIMLNAPGTRPEDNVELKACTLINMDGESKTYSWEDGLPEFDMDDANIQVVNFKSKYKPFMILREEAWFKVFGGEVREQYSHFPWWNHWPVAQVASDGRYASAPDRASHTSFSWGFKHGDAAMYGMTTLGAKHLADLSKSWLRAPEIKTPTKDVAAEYDRTQRAYLIDAEKSPRKLDFVIHASDGSPLINPAFVVSNWGSDDITALVDGKKLERGKSFRYGIEHQIDGSKTLIVWLKLKSTKETSLSIKAD